MPVDQYEFVAGVQQVRVSNLNDGVRAVPEGKVDAAFTAVGIGVVEEANAIALFPGGFGTHDEGFEILTLAQTGKSDPQPIVCLQAPGCDYWDDWSAFITRQLLRRKLINDEDLSLFTIVTSAEAAVSHILRFYRRYHSMRFVGRQLAIRLKQPVSAEQLEQIRERFSDLLHDGTFEQGGPLQEELDEPAIQALSRLIFSFNRRSAGRLRQLIHHLNDL